MKNLILAVILARSGSKGIKNKNIKILNGKPNSLVHSNLFKIKNKNKIVVSTDSKNTQRLQKLWCS